MSGILFLGKGSVPDRNSRRVVEIAIDLTKSSRTNGWIISGAHKLKHNISQWDIVRSTREQKSFGKKGPEKHNSN